jgi:TolA-binding protein
MFFYATGCNYISHRTISKDADRTAEDPEPDYNVSLDEDYQDFSSFIFMGNRIENFSTYFNPFYTAQSDFDDAMTEYRTSTISAYNRRLDSLNITPPLQGSTREKLNKVIERASKVLQYHKNSAFLDDAVLLIGKTYYFLTDYLQAERKFNEFLSKLSTSELSDEALLYLGRTKLRLGKLDEGQNILNNLVKNTTDPEIKSEAAQELGYSAVSKKNYADAVNYLKESINYTKDKERKAEKQYILGKIYTLQDPSQSPSFYLQSVNTTSDFDLQFYANLNYAKSLRTGKDYGRAGSLLNDLNSKYRDYPDYKQLVELEIANNLYEQGKYKDAKREYFETIIDYPASVVSADAYYFLARHYETIEKDYLEALVNYNKAVLENANSDYSPISSKRSEVLSRYFELKSVIDGTPAIQIPENNKDLERYRRIYEEEKGIIPPRQEGDPNGTDPKGGGYKFFFDSTNPGSDTAINNNTGDAKFDAYLELSEIFLYELNKPDSAEFYLKRVLDMYNEPARTSKVNYTLAVIYKNTGRSAEADALFRKIIQENPNTIFANESRKQIGIQEVEIEQDASEELYKDAARKIAGRDYTGASTSLHELLEKHPSSNYVPQALYTLGWLYENELRNADSSIMYYGRLSDNYPASEYTAQIKGKLELYNSTNGINKGTDTTTGTTPVDTTKKNTEPPVNTEIKEENTSTPPVEETTTPNTEEKLSPEEIERLLRESEGNENK